MKKFFVLVGLSLFIGCAHADVIGQCSIDGNFGSTVGSCEVINVGLDGKKTIVKKDYTLKELDDLIKNYKDIVVKNQTQVEFYIQLKQSLIDAGVTE